MNHTDTDTASKALTYHAHPQPGKIGVQITKPTQSQEDLSLAYTPGVAEPVLAIAKHPEHVYRYTGKNNLVGIITNGTAVLGLGNVGPLASKPVMEGKSVLFKHLANVNAFDIEVDAMDPDVFIETVKRIAPTFGGINLEDIKAPECFDIERQLIECLDIPVFHDDQHGTAITIAAGLLNALDIQNKSLKDAKIVFAGAGAAGIASAHFLLSIGASPSHITLVDSRGVIHRDRTDLNAYKRALATETNQRTLEDALVDADVFIGLASGGLLTTTMVTSMAQNPIIFALSNPEPEIRPELAYRTRDDLIMATGRSDYPNQINNVLCFPYIFRGALDAGVKQITHAMKLAAMHAIKDLVRTPMDESMIKQHPEHNLMTWGKQYIIPKPMDPRLCSVVSQAVARAALNTAAS